MAPIGGKCRFYTACCVNKMGDIVNFLLQYMGGTHDSVLSRSHSHMYDVYMIK